MLSTVKPVVTMLDVQGQHNFAEEVYDMTLSCMMRHASCYQLYRSMKHRLFLLQISLGRAPGTAYTTCLIVFMAIGLLVTTTLRVKANLGALLLNPTALITVGAVKLH